jgi:antitoxin VapB
MTDIRAIGPADWDGFFSVLRESDVPADFLDRDERDQGEHNRDPFAEWQE